MPVEMRVDIKYDSCDKWTNCITVKSVDLLYASCDDRTYCMSL